MLVGPKLFDHELYSGEEIEEAKHAFLDVLTRFDGLFDKGTYLISAVEPTAIDIVYYNEVSTILLLTRIGDKTFKHSYPHVTAWINNMQSLTELMTTEE